MKNLVYLIIFFITVSCTNSKSVYWCGDHPCINKKEREAYFKKNMIVEMKELKKTNSKNNSDIAKIIQNAKVEEKKRIINEKNLAKEAKLEEKRRIKEEKKMVKQAKLEEKRRIKEEKKIESDKDKQTFIKKKKEEKKLVSDSSIKNAKINLSTFGEIFKNIRKKNSVKSYPDINDIPN